MPVNPVPMFYNAPPELRSDGPTSIIRTKLQKIKKNSVGERLDREREREWRERFWDFLERENLGFCFDFIFLSNFDVGLKIVRIALTSFEGNKGAKRNCFFRRKFFFLLVDSFVQTFTLESGNRGSLLC